MPRIFISYRREDSLDIVGRIHDHLSAKYGKDDVFLDQTNIKPGSDWQTTITDFLSEGGFVLVIIGQKWLHTVQSRDVNKDILVDEIRFALNYSNATVIPVLVSDATMPSKSKIPTDIEGITALQGISVRSKQPDFDNDIARLIAVIDKHQPISSRIWQSMLAFIAVLLIIGIGLNQFGIIPNLSSTATESTIDPSATSTNVSNIVTSQVVTEINVSATTVLDTATMIPNTDTPPIASTASVSVSSEDFVVSRNFGGIQICTRDILDLSELDIEFVNANERYILGDTFPLSRQSVLNGQGCVCLVYSENEQPTQCQEGNSSLIQQSQSNWVTVELLLTLNGESCVIESNCTENCECANR